jgi:septal ring factor EnvC (AmiA/AmiB activator)
MLFFCSLLSGYCLADSGNKSVNNLSNSDKLEQLRQQIKALRAELNTDRERKQDLQSLLRGTETRIGKVAALLRGLKRQLRQQNRELKKLNKRRSKLNANLQVQRVNLARQIRAAYAIGQQEYIKILLNQQDPAAVSRTMTYYDYFHGARLKRIQSLDARLADLQLVEQKIKRKKAKLEQNRLEQSHEKNQLEKNRGQRAEVLARLNQQMQAKGEKLSLMLGNQRRLQRLLNRLVDEEFEDIEPDLIPEQGERIAFARLRGKLTWPSRGRLTNRYGSRRNVGKLKWQGVMIKAPEGTEVTAISHGRVAFSDWLRGFGLLTIIDHGDGYMSLYGGNQSLYKEVGDWVEASEVIASVGNSGGNKNTALYFEIRHKGKPTNPLKWCRNKPKKLARR